ncbi:MAG: ribonuclease VapC [Candidatus Methanomethylicota archaeon]|uniref:Ribonuclease VapC n=1 Tax=Thermoproteota archaeon TaxID=2056631 RepID=A0A497EPE8_9CREN|nr:MAG: ribonuclease VapC [Candidatus Verstraetearchaeota archaeon]
MRKKIYVLDAAAVLHGFPIGEEKHEIVMSEKTMEEVISKKEILDLYLNIGKLKKAKPSDSCVKQVIDVAKETGDYAELTDADVDTIAIALTYLQLGNDVVLITDDYSIQNVANKLSIQYKPITTTGIKYEIKWVTYCPGCKSKYYDIDENIGICPKCGHTLSRKAVKKLKVK